MTRARLWGARDCSPTGLKPTYDLAGAASERVDENAADAAFNADGRVIGVMPRALVEAGNGHTNLSEMLVVETIHERKAAMAELSDAFLALPGEVGTLEEIAEQWTWAQLGFHQKPCVFLNTLDFYSPLRDFANRMVHEDSVRPEYVQMLIFEKEIERILIAFGGYIALLKKSTTPSG